jgi:hypothetical protein
MMATVCGVLNSTELDTRLYQVGCRSAAVFIFDTAHIFHLCIRVFLYQDIVQYVNTSYRNKMAAKHAITHTSLISNIL